MHSIDAPPHQSINDQSINLRILHSLLPEEASTFLLRLELLDLVATFPDIEEEETEEEEKTLGARSLLPVVAVGRMNRLGSGSLFS